MTHYVATLVERTPYQAGALSVTHRGQTFTSTDVGAQLRVLYDRPATIVELPLTTLLNDPWLLRQFMGIFGWLNVFLPDASYWAIEGSLATAIFSELLLRPRAGPKSSLAVCYILSAISAVWAVYVIQYLTWTNVGQPYIDGVSGRYFIPLVPIIALAIPHISRSHRPGLARACGFLVVSIALVNTVVTATTLYATYYDPGDLLLYLRAIG